jgi:glycosyltransferase involved in cell wall biosynthesis
MLKISLGTRFEGKMKDSNGYGYATKCMLESLDRLGYHVDVNDSSADVEIWFEQPHHWKFSTGPYRIGYHPWESTLLQDGWAEIMNSCNEVWTPSPLIAEWYTNYSGITVPVYVYQHGIEHSWEPYERKPQKLKFLHVGTEATRKGGWDCVPCFRRAFPQRGGKSLTLKMVNSNWNGIKSVNGINYLNKEMPFNELQDLFYHHDVYVYPSWGEGFGLTPLQAMATGMPTITLPGWAPYAQFLDPHLEVGHEMYKSPWQKIHPGKMMKPNLDDVVRAMRYAADNYDEVSAFAMARAVEIHKAYDWDTITSQVFTDLKNRLSNLDEKK